MSAGPILSSFECASVPTLCEASAAGAAARAALRAFLQSSLAFTCAADGAADAGAGAGAGAGFAAWLSPVGGGITNGLVCVRSAGEAAAPLLVRVFGAGTELLIDRARDTGAAAFLSAAGLAPRLHAVFANGRVEAFLPTARALAPADMGARKPRDVLAALAAAVARFHALLPQAQAAAAAAPAGAESGGGGGGCAGHTPVLWTRLERFADLAQAAYPAALRAGRAPRFAVDWQAVRAELAWLRTVLPSPDNGEGAALLDAALAAGASPAAAAAMRAAFRPVYAHNDLLSGNVLMLDGDAAGADTASAAPALPHLLIIDYEYADNNYAGHDLANNVCEHAGFECNWAQDFPPAAVRRSLVEHYVAAAAALTGGPAAPPADVDAGVMTAWVERFCLASHLWWGLWALVQCAHSPIDFDFEGYFSRRMEGYLRHKAEFFPGTPLPVLFTTCP